MASKINFDYLSFNLGQRHFEGKHVATGIALGIAASVIYGLRRFFAGGWCYIQKDMTGKNIVITGGNTGIGKETARRLVELGANVYIGARDEKKNKETVDELSKIKKGKIISFNLDLADKASIQVFADEIRKQLGGQPLHYLLNNAGVMAVLERKLTKDNFQLQIGTNHFGHFFLTYLLWDKLKQSGNPRIVNVSSSFHSFSGSYDIDFDNIHFQNGGYDSLAAYSHSKKANILFTKQLQRRMNESRVNGVAVALHPGVVRTELLRNYVSSWWRRAMVTLLYPVRLFLCKTAPQGAQTNLYCVLEDDIKLLKGGYYEDCRLYATSVTAPQVKSRQAAQRLWVESQKAFGIKFNV